MSWLKARGYQNIDQDVADNTRGHGPRSYWMPPNTSNVIGFLEDEPPRFHIHEVKFVDQKRPVILTCPDADQPDKCPLCSIGDQPVYVGVWPIVNFKEWVDKKGNKHKETIELYYAKGKVMTKLARRSEDIKKEKKKADGLASLVYKVSRGDQKTPVTGDDFELKAKIPAEKLAELKKKMPNLEEALRPDMLALQRTARKLREQASGGKQAKTADERAGAPAEGSKGPGDDINWNE